jgi:hypothetical protein
MAIPESFDQQKQIRDTAAELHFELNQLIFAIEGLNATKAHDPDFLNQTAAHIKKLYEIISRFSKK